MKEFKGTKGEWEIIHDINVTSVKDERPICACGTFNPKEGNNNQKVNKANAQLIAAAPELLAALQKLWQNTKEDSGLDYSDIECLSKTFGIEKAINKALGK